jgi:hypothetical protein
VSALILLASVAVTGVLVGLIWTVQLVQYPQLHRVSAPDFRAYHAGHLARIGPLVGPLMVVEGALAVAWVATAGAAMAEAVASLVLLGIVWATTAWVSVPLHDRLSRGHDPVAITRLVRTNWVRTGAWTARFGLALSVIRGTLPA